MNSLQRHWEVWRERIGRSALKAEDVIRLRRVRNMSEIRSIGMVYDATDREVFEYINEVVRRFRAEMKKVHTLGYINSKDDRDMLSSKLGFDFFNRKNLDFYLRPSHPLVDNFIGENFDLLIDFNVERLWPLEYVMKRSRAALKVGLWPQANSPYDLSFKVTFPPGTPPYSRHEKLRLMQELVINIRKYLHAI